MPISISITAQTVEELDEWLDRLLYGSGPRDVYASEPVVEANTVEDAPAPAAVSSQVSTTKAQPTFQEDDEGDGEDADVKPVRGKNAEALADKLIAQHRDLGQYDQADYDRLPRAQQKRVDEALDAAMTSADERSEAADPEPEAVDATFDEPEAEEQGTAAKKEEAAAISQADATIAMQKAIQAIGADAVRSVLRTYGANRLSEVPDSRLGEFVVALENYQPEAAE